MDSNNQNMSLDGKTVADAIEFYLREKVLRPGTTVKITSSCMGSCDGPYAGLSVNMVLVTPEK
jgi:hypothetical protein